MFVSEYSFQSVQGRYSTQENLTTEWELLLIPAVRTGTVGQLLFFSCRTYCCACQNSDVWVQLINEDYTVSTSNICKLLRPVENSAINVEGRSGEISSFHYSTIEGKWQTKQYLTFHWLHRSVGF